MLTEHEEELLGNKVDAKDGVSSLEDRLEEELLLSEGGFIEEALLNDQLVAICNQLIFPVGFAGESFGVRVVADDLSWILTEVSNLSLKGLLFIPLLDLVQVDGILIGEGVEYIHTLDGVFSSLFVAVYQINPVVDVLRNIPAFQFAPEF